MEVAARASDFKMTIEQLISEFRDNQFTFKDALKSLENYPKVSQT